jgi:hypothetical protein
VLLAGTIPHDSTRAALARVLRKYSSEGPKPLEAAGWPERIITDPGLVVLVKSLPRRETKPAKAPAGGQPRVAGPARSGSAAAAKAAEAAKQAAQKKEQKERAEQDWLAVSSKLVAVWCKRLHAAAAVKEKAAGEAARPVGEAAPKLPDDFELDAGAKVVAAYHALWPDEAPPAMLQQEPSPLEVHYVRVEETKKPKTAIGFYSRQAQAKPSDIRTIDNGVWIDSLRPVSQNDRRRSLDVLITRTVRKAGDLSKDEEETELVVDILIIEIKDPAGRQ